MGRCSLFANRRTSLLLHQIDMNLPPIPPQPDFALFLDFDGTVVEIAERPELVRLGASTLQALTELSRLLEGALAIVTGREIEAIDRFMAPLKLPVAGIHGLERRDAGGARISSTDASEVVASLTERLAPLVDSEIGLMLEQKTSALALHYRARPELESTCLRAFEDAIADMPGIELKRGKMVLEAKPNGKNKGTAILDFLEEEPFRGRTPWFAGDDITDEDAFQVVNGLGGVSVKVGEGPTVANYRAKSTASFLAWLEAAVQHIAAEVKR